jgi:hypothetical protein
MWAALFLLEPLLVKPGVWSQYVNKFRFGTILLKNSLSQAIRSIFELGVAKLLFLLRRISAG